MTTGVGVITSKKILCSFVVSSQLKQILMCFSFTSRYNKDQQQHDDDEET